MIVDRPDYVCGYLAVDFARDFAIYAKLADAAARLRDQLDIDDGAQFDRGYVLRDYAHTRLISITAQRLSIASLGFATWDNPEPTGRAVQAAVEALGVTTIKRVGFQTNAHLVLNMSHAELTNLVEACYLVPETAFAHLCGTPDNVLIHLYGNYGQTKTRLGIVPQTAVQAYSTFRTVNAQIIDALQFGDATANAAIAQFGSRISQDLLFLELDQYRQDILRDAIPAFLNDAIGAAERITGDVVSQMLAKTSI